MLRFLKNQTAGIRGPARSWEYAVVGAILALGAPVGLFLLRAYVESAWPWSAHLVSWADWAEQEISANVLEYGYLLFSTPAIFAVLGFLVGRTQQRLEKQALVDRLTGLPNRAYYETRLASEIARAVRYHAPLSVLLLDLDNLKTTNDSGGHRAGDAALQAVAHALRGTIRETDLAARVGGDEFVVLAPSTTGEEAMELARRTRMTLSSLRSGTSVSIGVAALPLDGRCNAERLLSAADEALYAAKWSGRNCERLAGRPPGKESGAFAVEVSHSPPLGTKVAS